MYLSDVNNVLNNIEIRRDGVFEKLYLVGKPYKDGTEYLSFIGGVKYIDDFLKYKISSVICTEEVASILSDRFNGGIAISSDPKKSFFEIHNYISEKNETRVPSKVSEKAIIDESAVIDKYGVTIGDNTQILSNVRIKAGTTIGDNCIIRENCVLGSPAFYYYGNGDEKKLVISSGGIVIKNNVELHTGITVEKGVMDGDTIIGNNTKIDNNCLIGHDSVIGNNVTIAAGSTLAGGVYIGNGSFAGVGVTFAPWVTCGKNSKMSAGAVVTRDVPDDTHVSGNFAIEHSKYLEHIKCIR